MNKTRLIDQVPASLRYQVRESGAFQRICSDFVGKHLQHNAYEVVELARKQNAESGEYEEELEELAGKPDYVEECANNDIQIVDDGGTYYWFNWADLDTIPLDDKGDSFLDFAKFAEKHGLDLSAWGWDKMADQVVLLADVTDDHDVDKDEPLLEAIGTATADVADAIDALAAIARHEGKEGLAKQLSDKGADSLKKLFSGFVAQQYPLARDTFDSEEEAAKDACEECGFDVDPPEVYEYKVISDRLAYLLEKEGEAVCNDFLGLTVWGRCTTGQSVSMDGVIQRICWEECDDQVEALLKEMFPHLGSTDEKLPGVAVNSLAALEEGRVHVYTYNYTKYNEDQSRRFVVVHAAGLAEGEPAKGWLIENVGQGLKSDRSPGEPVEVQRLEDWMRAHGVERGDGLTESAPSQALVDTWVKEIAWFHERNQESPLHVVPERLQERLAKLSPSYAQAHANDGPSLG